MTSAQKEEEDNKLPQICRQIVLEGVKKCKQIVDALYGSFLRAYHLLFDFHLHFLHFQI